MSANAPPFYPAADTVESVVESALDDLNLDDFDVTELEKELNNASPVSSTLGESLSALNITPMCSAPVTIPGAEAGSPQPFTQSPTSPLGQFSSSYSSTSQLMSGQKVLTFCICMYLKSITSFLQCHYVASLKQTGPCLKQTVSKNFGVESSNVLPP